MQRATCNDKCQKSINSNCRLSARWAAFISWACAWGAWVRILCCQLLFPRRWRRHVYLWPVRPSPSPSSLARVRASRRVISCASATIRASHIVAPRHLSNRTLHSLQFFQCQSDCCRLARQCEHTRTVAGWPWSIRIDTPKQHVAVPARAVRVVGAAAASIAASALPESGRSSRRDSTQHAAGVRGSASFAQSIDLWGWRRPAVTIEPRASRPAAVLAQG